VAQDYSGLLRGADLVPSLASGALPPEAVTLVREVLLLSPHLTAWLSRAAAEAAPHLGAGAVSARLTAEMALRYDASGAYTAASGLSASAQPRPAPAVHTAGPAHEHLAAEELRRHSLLAGVEPDPVGFTSWAQPWVPLWLDYEFVVRRAPAPG